MQKPKEHVCITGIMLRTTTDEIIVEIEVNEQWVEIINDWVGPIEFAVSRIVEPAGILPHIPTNNK